MTPVPAEKLSPAKPARRPKAEVVTLSRWREKISGLARSPGDDKDYADALISRLQQDRLLWAVAPRPVGGLGFSLQKTASLTFEIAALSGSAGLIYAMHVSQALSVIRHGGSSPFFRDFLSRMVRDQCLIASGTSEKGVGGDIFASLCTVESMPDGSLMIRKESPNISYLDHARAVLITAMKSDANGRRTQVLAAAETSRMEVEPGRGTGFLGMKGILNRSYRLKAQFGSEAIFAEAYPAIARETMTPSVHILWAALWSGIAYHALGKAKAFIAKEVQGDAAMAAHMRSELSRLAEKHFVMIRLVRQAAEAFDNGNGASRNAMDLGGTADVKRLKIVCSELLEEIVLGALSLIGIRAYAEGGPYSLAEPVRDALSAKVMISNARLRSANAEIERFIDERL